MPFCQLYYHLVWSTKNREPLIKTAYEQLLYASIQGKVKQLRCICYAIGGNENHIHLVLAVPPHLPITEVVKQIKGSSSYSFNKQASTSDKFYWQKEYGAFSLGRKQLEKAVEYVRHQKEHHAAGSLIEVLERTTDR